MAEDMEFSECCALVFFTSIVNDTDVGVKQVDTAATQRDSLKRLAFVAAFAMSNYSSTIGRIAKPFNPMLVCGFFKVDLWGSDDFSSFFFRARRLST